MATHQKALCVGINTFANFPGAALQGCVNDAHDMEGILKEYLGFAQEDIVTLTNEQATKKNMLAQLRSMVKGAKAGTFQNLVFSLSSHGTQVPDRNADEEDRADEAFCPHDLAQKGDAWDPKHIITDDELHDLFIELPEDVFLEVYLDTCHSGTGLKALDCLLDRKPRYMPPPSLRAFEALEHRSVRGLHRCLVEKSVTRHVLWAGCRSDQTSADARIAGAWHGAFTYYLCKNLRAKKNRVTRNELITLVNADLRKNRYTQIAQLECEATVRSKSLA